MINSAGLRSLSENLEFLLLFAAQFSLHAISLFPSPNF